MLAYSMLTQSRETQVMTQVSNRISLVFAGVLLAMAGTTALSAAETTVQTVWSQTAFVAAAESEIREQGRAAQVAIGVDVTAPERLLALGESTLRPESLSCSCQGRAARLARHRKSGWHLLSGGF